MSSLRVTEPLAALLRLCLEHECSDLHLSVGSPPVGRQHGLLIRLPGAVFAEQELERLITEMLSIEANELLNNNRSIDGACSWEGQRFRLNLYRERGYMAAAIRHLQPRIPTPNELNLPDELMPLIEFPHGLVLVTGPTGSGKSTTLAALLHQINLRRACHIITIEDPIEYFHTHQCSLVHQREIGTDATTFAAALREAMREDPDVILVGEMRDLATARAALTAAETGHLVFSTLHCGDSVGALDRILSLYPAEEQEATRRQLALTLRAVVAQKLMPRVDKPGRVPAVELLRCIPSVQNLIRTAQFNQMYTSLETGMTHGMISYERSLADLVLRGWVDDEQARSQVRNERLFGQLLTRGATQIHTTASGGRVA